MTAAHQLPLDLDAAAGSEQAAAAQRSRRPGRRGAKLAAVPPQSDSERLSTAGRSKGAGGSAEGRTATYVCETNGRTYPFGGGSGAKQHYRTGQPVCEPCRKSYQERDRRRRRESGMKPLSAVEGEPGTYRCTNGRFYREGTHAGAEAHRRRGEEVCPSCREAARARGRAWQKTAKGRVVRRRNNRKRREQELRAHIEWVDEAEILAKTDGRCWLCGIEVDLDNRQADNGFHVEHIWPLSVGGLGWEPNLMAGCRACNISGGKHNKILDFRFAFVGLIPPPHLWLEDREWPDVPPRSEWVLDGRALEVDQMMQRIGARERFTPPPAPAKWKAFRQAGIRPTGKMRQQFKAAITVKENNDPAS